MANDIDKTSPHYKGDFGSIYEVNKKFPTGGVAGDFVVIQGWAHYWNADRATWCVNAERDSYWDELITNIIEKFKLVRGATYMGVASLGTVPEKVIGAKLYYFATEAGTYKNFGNLAVPQGINVLYSENGSSWINSSLLEVAQELGVSTKKVVSQKVLNDVLLKKFDKENIVQKSGEAEDKVMSQKAVSDKLSDLSSTINERYSSLTRAIGEELTEYKYQEIPGELYMNSSGGIVVGYSGQHIKYIRVKSGDLVVISSKDQPFDDMEFASAAFFTEEPKLYSFAKEIISRGGNFTIEYTCLENGYIAVWQKSNGKARLYSENVEAYKLVQAKEDGVLTGYYMDINGKITSLGVNNFKVHYFPIKNGESVYITDEGHLIAEDYNFTKAIFTTIKPDIDVTGTIIIGSADKNQVVYTADKDGYICIQERNNLQYLTLYNRTKQTILEHIHTESADVYDVNEHTTPTHIYGLTATKQRAFIQFDNADANTDTTIELTCGENRYTATISKSSSVSILAEEFINAFSVQVKDYNLLWAGGATVTFSAKEIGNKGAFSAEIISSSSTKISYSVNYGVDSALALVPYNQYKLGRIIRFLTNPALSSRQLKDAYENWIYVGNTPNDFYDPTKWELLGNKYSYEGKLLTSIGDSTSGMERWQSFVCRELCCTYTASAISGGTLNAIYKSTVEAVSPDSDFVTIQYGTNDWANEALHLGNITDMADGSNPTTFCGALNYVCKWLSENVVSKNPYCRILMWTPLQRNDGISKRLGFLYGYDDDTKEAKNKEGKTLADYADAIIKIAGIWGFSVLDTHRKSGINRITIGTWNENYTASNDSKYEDYYQDNSIDGQRNFIGGLLYDGLHPNYEPGGRILGHMIAEALKRI